MQINDETRVASGSRDTDGRLLTVSDATPDAYGNGVFSAIPSYVGGFAGLLNFGDVSLGVGLDAVEIGEAVDFRELPAGPSCTAMW